MTELPDNFELSEATKAKLQNTGDNQHSVLDDERKSLERARVKQTIGNVASASPSFGGMTAEELLAVAPEDAQLDLVAYIEDMIFKDMKDLMTLEHKRAIALKVSYWTQLFYSKGALEFQKRYEAKIREAAAARLVKHNLERSKLIVPFKYRGKDK